MDFTEKTGAPAYGDSFLYIAEAVFIFLFFTLKLYFFYIYVGIGRYSPVLTAASLAAAAVLYYLIIRFTRFNPTFFLLALYAAASFFMCVDRVYYSYLRKLPSLAAAKMACQLADIAPMVLKLVNAGHAAYLIDLPLWLIFIVNFKGKLSSRLSISAVEAAARASLYTRRFAACFAAFCVLVVGGSAVFGSFRVAYLKNEVLTYHLSDAASMIINKIAPRSSDASQYIYASAKARSSPYFGAATGRNVITIQVEALQSFAVGLVYNGQEVTPNLNKLIAGESLYFDNYYYQVGGGNTADAEFAVNNSLYAPENEAAYVKYERNDFFGLPWLLKDNGYTGSYAFHGYKGDFWNREKAYPAQGFDDFTSAEDFNITESFNMGMSDKQFFSQSLEIMKTYSQPFYSFLITLSSHYPYVIPENLRGIELLPEDRGTLVGDYIEAVHYADEAIGEFIEGLKEAGLYENSIISIYGDHYAIPSGDAANYSIMTRLLGHDYYEKDIFKVPFIINIPGAGLRETVHTVGGHIDNLPTMLSLLGIVNDKSAMFGHDMLAEKDGVVYEQTHMARGSFISDGVIFSYPENGIMEYAAALDRKTGAAVSANGYDDIIAAAKKAYSDCDALLTQNKAVFADLKK